MQITASASSLLEFKLKSMSGLNHHKLQLSYGTPTKYSIERHILRRLMNGECGVWLNVLVII